MAREMVLVPKSKYEYMLKQLNEYSDRDLQGGGEGTKREENSLIGKGQPDENILNGELENTAEQFEVKKKMRRSQGYL